MRAIMHADDQFRIACATAAMFAGMSSSAPAQDQVARGKYLATFGGCTDCHTPGYFFGKPDEKRYLGGSEVGFEIPGLGVFHGPNLTPDKETGLGNWSNDADRRRAADRRAARQAHPRADHAVEGAGAAHQGRRHARSRSISRASRR